MGCGHKCARTSLAIFTVFGTLLSLVAAFSCDFVIKIEYTYWYGHTWNGLGFLGRSKHGFEGSSDFCVGWSSEEKEYLLDGYWNAGFAFALLAFSLGMLTMIGSFLFCCLGNVTNKIYCSLVIIYVFTAMFQGLTFVSFASDVYDTLESWEGLNYHVGVGAGCAILATIVWLLCAILAGRSKIQNEIEEQAEEQVQHYNNEPIIAKAVFASEEPIVNETVTVREDGTRVIERLTMFPDGSQETTTIEEKPVENPAESPV